MIHTVYEVICKKNITNLHYYLFTAQIAYYLGSILLVYEPLKKQIAKKNPEVLDLLQPSDKSV